MSSDCGVQNDVSNVQLMPLTHIDDSLSIKEIIKNDVEPVIVTHINSPSDFYLHLIANDSIMTTITNELYKFIHTKHNGTLSIEGSEYIINITIHVSVILNLRGYNPFVSPR